ncbi:MAG: hypothetical protein GXY44_08035 [Phycisphaerales bacterium]|nr:hypothetical protein [Phycisphaerales bacterium]
MIRETPGPGVLGRLIAASTLTAVLAMVVYGGEPVVHPTIYVLDMRPSSKLSAESRYDLRHAGVCIQGIANRDAPRAFILFMKEDAWWLERLREPGGLCEGWPVVTLPDFDAWLAHFRDRIQGVVLYDPAPETGVISTSLVATTAAGVLDGIALRKDTAPDSMYHRIVVDPAGPRLPVLIDLTGKFTGTGTIWQTETPSTGSARCDAYIWAKEKFLDTGRCDPTVLMYTLDLWGLKLELDLQTQLSNLDYAVSRRGFCFELTPWGDEAPNDDPEQPIGTDHTTTKAILDACNQQTRQQHWIKLCGFVNWLYKYTSRTGGKHREVATEWEHARLLSAYNVYKEADAARPQWVTNASFHAGLAQAVALRRHLQNPPPTYDDMRARGLIAPNGTVPDGNYIMIGMGDYDQASWILNALVPHRYHHSTRGQIDCNWGINPNAVDRASVAMDYIFRHKTPRDIFFAWDSGAGYINPSQIHGNRAPSGYPSAAATWREHCKHYYRMFDYSITAWMLNGSTGPLDRTDFHNYAPFSGDGIGQDAGKPAGPYLEDNVPVLRRSGPDNPSPGKIMDKPEGVNFAWYRTILWTPESIKKLNDAYTNSGNNHRFLDAYSFYYLMRHHLGGHNHYRTAWVSDNIPRIVRSGTTMEIEATVRNDGWDTWSEADNYRLGIAIMLPGQTPSAQDYDFHGRGRLADGMRVAPGQRGFFRHTITVPATAGIYDLYYDMVHEGVTWFRDAHNIEWKQPLIVADDPWSVDTDGDGLPDLWEIENGRLFWHPDDVGPSGGEWGFDKDRPSASDQRPH